MSGMDGTWMAARRTGGGPLWNWVSIACAVLGPVVVAGESEPNLPCTAAMRFVRSAVAAATAAAAVVLQSLPATSAIGRAHTAGVTPNVDVAAPMPR